MKRLTEAQVESFLKSLESDYDVRVPVRLLDGTRSLGRLGDGPLALAGGPLPQKPTQAFFPQMEVILSLHGTDIRSPRPADRPLLVVGFTGADLDCLAFIDRFYGETFRDTVYFSKRDKAVVAAVTGRCGPDGKGLAVGNGHGDMEMVCDGRDYILIGRSEAGKALVNRAPGSSDVTQAQVDAIGAEAASDLKEDQDLLEKASRLLLEDRVPEEFWDGIADQCIACTSCNLACPTCTCFDVFDRKADARDERWRMWDSCQLDGFMREASGHNPMAKEGTRTRRRIHHKLGADPRRWGQITCMLCGRCDNVCPTGIGIKAVCRQIVDTCGKA